MIMTILALALAMLLIAKLAHDAAGRTKDEPETKPEWPQHVLLAAMLAVLSGYAWAIEADSMPALVCLLALPFPIFMPGRGIPSERIASIALISAGAALLLFTPGALNSEKGTTEPILIFDDLSRTKELRARAKACETTIEVIMLQRRERGDEKSADDIASLSALKLEVESIIRMLERGEGTTAPTDLRLSRLEAVIETEFPSAN